MRKFLHLAIIAGFAAACSSPANVQPNVKTVETNVAVNQPIAAATANQSNINVEAEPNYNKVVIGDALVSKKNADKIRGKNAVGKETTPMTGEIGAVSAAAPDDSEIFSQMNEKGQPLETRVFKNNRALAKIERLYVTMENPTLTVYLKNGKTVKVPNGAIANPLTASAAEILQAAGVK